MSGYGTQPFSIVRRTSRGQAWFEVMELWTGRKTRHATKREATKRAKEVERDYWEMLRQQREKGEQ
jgi:hypothetical protein